MPTGLRGSDGSSAPPAQRRVIKRYSKPQALRHEGEHLRHPASQIAEMIQDGEDVRDHRQLDEGGPNGRHSGAHHFRRAPDEASRDSADDAQGLIRHREAHPESASGGADRQADAPRRRGGLAAPASGFRSPVPPSQEDDMQAKKARVSEPPSSNGKGVVDERIQTALPNFAAFRELEQQVKRLSERLRCDRAETRRPRALRARSSSHAVRLSPRLPGGDRSGPGRLRRNRRNDRRLLASTSGSEVENASLPVLSEFRREALLRMPTLWRWARG